MREKSRFQHYEYIYVKLKDIDMNSSEKKPSGKVSEDYGSMDKNELFEELLKDTGGFGRFQYLVLSLSILASILCGCNHLSPVYIAYTPKFNCIDDDSM